VLQLAAAHKCPVGALLPAAGIIVPPVPEKNAMSKLQMTTEFIEMRRRTLTSFINRVVTTSSKLLCS